MGKLTVVFISAESKLLKVLAESRLVPNGDFDHLEELVVKGQPMSRYKRRRSKTYFEFRSLDPEEEGE